MRKLRILGLLVTVVLLAMFTFTGCSREPAEPEVQSVWRHNVPGHGMVEITFSNRALQLTGVAPQHGDFYQIRLRAVPLQEGDAGELLCHGRIEIDTPYIVFVPAAACERDNFTATLTNGVLRVNAFELSDGRRINIIATPTPHGNPPGPGDTGTPPIGGTQETIDLLTIPLFAPAAGMVAQHTIETAQYTGTVVWTPPIPQGGTFSATNIYVANITLSPTHGFTIAGVAANAFSVLDTAATVSNLANSGLVTAAFPPTLAAVPINIPMIGVAPFTGMTAPDSFENEQFTATITWVPDDATFQAGVTYQMVAIVTPRPGRTLPANIQVMAADSTVANATSTTPAGPVAVVTNNFGVTAALPSGTAGIPAAAAGTITSAPTIAANIEIGGGGGTALTTQLAVTTGAITSPAIQGFFFVQFQVGPAAGGPWTDIGPVIPVAPTATANLTPTVPLEIAMFNAVMAILDPAGGDSVHFQAIVRNYVHSSAGGGLVHVTEGPVVVGNIPVMDTP